MVDSIQLPSTRVFDYEPEKGESEEYSPTRHLAITVWLGSCRGNNLMSMLAAYYDESGTPDVHAVVVSGFVSTVEKWVRFERDWKRAHADFGLLASCRVFGASM